MHHAARLENAEPLGQQLRADPGQARADFGEAARPEHQLAHDQQRPALAHDLEAGVSWSALRLPAVEARVAEASARLGDAEWFTGSFTAGDLMMISVLLAIEGSALLAAHPNLVSCVSYVSRGTARPAFRQALADQMAGFTGHPPPGVAVAAAGAGEVRDGTARLS
ncbi:glutathione S-transferase [Roseivivax isoporae LMG 25204]|uniref:Glutathione S-transferase n=1 Tax=Roseivivax isoporae LMG 25204 TaxID=1449351 RepID=X7FDI1_9RHOB|nr:glutathione S-transferase [Roseivivax isoporae LMG 25204]